MRISAWSSDVCSSDLHIRLYRPARAVVVIVGDGDPADFVRLIRTYFGDWKATGANPAEPDFGKPDPKEPVTRVIVEPNQPLSLTLAKIRPWIKRLDTVENTRRLYLEFLAIALVNRRLEYRARAGGSYLVATVPPDYLRDRKSTRLNSSHQCATHMPSS